MSEENWIKVDGFSRVGLGKNSLDDDRAVLRKHLQQLLKNCSSEAERWSQVLLDDQLLAKVGPSLARYLEDVEICRSCTGLSSCPKKQRKGHVYRLVEDGDLFVDRESYCSYRIEQRRYEKNLLYSDYPLEKIADIDFRIKDRVKQLTSFAGFAKFWSAVGRIDQALRNFSSQEANRGFAFVAPNSNSDVLGLYLAGCALTRGLKVAVIDVEKSLIPRYGAGDQEGVSGLLRILESSDIIIIFNFDLSPKRMNFLDHYLMPLLRKVNRPGKLGALVLHQSLSSSAVFGYKSQPDRDLLSTLIKIVDEYSIVEPNIFAI